MGTGIEYVLDPAPTPPSYAPNASAVVHATATVGALVREAGETVTVS
jgi:hypothetical protein